MSNKFWWLLGFIVAAAISCWATSSSLILMMPSFISSNPIIQTIGVWLLVLLLFVLASLSMKWIVDALNNQGEHDHPHVMLWGGLLTLIITWLVVSMPTNAHTFFYQLKIGDVVTQDLLSTRQYSQQLADREFIDSAYYKTEAEVLKEWSLFVDEVKRGKGRRGSGIGIVATSHISNINQMLGSKYMISIPSFHNASDQELTNEINRLKETSLQPNLKRFMSDNFQVSAEAATEAKEDVRKILAMEDTIHKLINSNQISDGSSEPVIAQADGVLKVAYSNINKNHKYIRFNDKDKEWYVKQNIETRTSRFLNPYSVLYDFFTGKIPVTFIFWLLLSIVIDLAGFFFFYQWNKDDFDY